MGGIKALGRGYRHLNRYREVTAILVKHGFGDLLHVLKVDEFVEGALRGLLAGRGRADLAERPERVRLAIEELGPTFIKLGQYLSTRADLLPGEYLRELVKLQDRVPPFPADEARRVVQEELGKPVAKLFRHFDSKPLAAASIAQVHAAELKDGTPVVVKIERPDLRRRVAVDLEIMAHLASLAEKHLESWSWRKPGTIVAELARSLDREMDFAIEAAHAERFARQFAGDASARAPRVHRALSSPRVLTLDRLEGVKLDASALERAGVDPRAVAARLAQHYLAMIFVHGFFHADPHPGNLLALEDGAIGYLDFGMAGRLDRRTREALADIVHAVVERDQAALGRSLLALADYDEEPQPRAFEEDVAALMDQYAYRPLAEWRLGRMLEQLFHTTGRHRVRIPAELFLLVKTLTELESLARSLDPAFDAVSAVAPFIRWSREERLKPRRLAATLAEAGREAASLLASAPSDLREVIRQLRRGRLLIEFEHRGLETGYATLDKVSNRLAVAVLLGALVIGSALLVHARVPPFWNGIPVLGAGGFLLASLMAVWLLAAVLRHGRL